MTAPPADPTQTGAVRTPPRTAPDGARLVMNLPHGLAWCAADARRGELTCWPEWAEAPYDAMDSASARPILAQMGADIGGDRREVR